MQAGNEDDCFVIEQITVSDSDDEPEFCEPFAVTLNDDFNDSLPKVFTADGNIRTSSPTVEESSEEEMEKSDTIVEVGRLQAVESSENSGDELSGKNGNTKDFAKARRCVSKMKAARRSGIKQEVKKEPTNSEKMRLKIEKVETLKRNGSGNPAEIRQQPSVPAPNPVATDGSGGQCTGYVLVPIQMPFPMMAFGGMMPIFAGCQMPPAMMTSQAVMAAQSFMGLPACQTSTTQLAAFQPTGQLMVQPTVQPTSQPTVQPTVQLTGQPALHPTVVQPPAEPEPAIACSAATGSVDKPSSAVDSSAVECVLTTDEDLTDWKLCATTVVNLCQKNGCASNEDSPNDTDAQDHFQDCDDGIVYDSDANASPRKVHSSPQKKRSFTAAANKQYKCSNCGKKFKYRFSPRRRIEIALGRYYCDECVGKMAEPRELVGRITALRSGKKPVDGHKCDKLLCSTDAISSGKPVIALKPPASRASDEKFTDEVRVKLERLDDVETVKKSRARRSSDGVCMATRAKPFQPEIFCCEQCDKKFNHALSLFKHSKKHSFMKKPVKCRTCDKRFENLRMLNAHDCGDKSASSDSPKLTKSKDENKHKCAACGRWFRKLRSFSGEKQSQCLKCGQKGQKQLTLKKLQEPDAAKSKSLPRAKDDSHKSSSKTAKATPNKTGKKPFNCLKCFKTFRHGHTLASHTERKHCKKSK